MTSRPHPSTFETLSQMIPLYLYLRVSHLPPLLNGTEGTNSENKNFFKENYLKIFVIFQILNYLKYILLLTMTKKSSGKMPWMIIFE